MELLVENDLDFCRRQALNCARRAVYSRDQKTRRALATMAQGWAELARAVGSVEPISAEFRLDAEISESAHLRILRDAEQELEHYNVVSLLKANLREEKAADKKLSGLAEGGLNRKASGHRVAAERSSALRKTGTARKGATRKTASRGKSAASRKTR
jgi:hypothetical protein